MQRWSELSPDARNKLVANTIMDGELTPYTEDLNAAYRVAEAVALDKREMKSLHLSITPTIVGHGVGRCHAYFGHPLSDHIMIGAPTPAQAMCLAALYKYDVQFEDGQELRVAEKQLGGLHKLGNIATIEYV
jgi:hypothetical protein